MDKRFHIGADLYIPVSKAGAPLVEKQYTLSPLLIPDSPDLEGDTVSRDEIEKSIWGMGLNDKLLDLEHYLVNEKLGRPVEKYVLPADTLFVKNAQIAATPEAQQRIAQIAQLHKELSDMGAYRVVPEGSGMLGTVWTGMVWNLIKSGRLRGMSIWGRGTRTPVQPAAPVAPAIPAITLPGAPISPVAPTA